MKLKIGHCFYEIVNNKVTEIFSFWENPEGRGDINNGNLFLKLS